MALIPTLRPVAAGSALAFVASTPAGDKVSYGGGDLFLEFRNSHASSITITIPKVQTSAIAPGAGALAVPDKVLALAAGADGVFRFKRGEVSAYVDTLGQLTINYTSGNALLLVRPLEHD